MTSSRIPDDSAVLLGDGTALCESDAYLLPHAAALRERQARLRAALSKLAPVGGVVGWSQGHHYFGLHRGHREEIPGVWYREWAPGARALFLTGDFNDWNRRAHPLSRDAYGVWSVFVPALGEGVQLVHGSRLKVHVLTAEGGTDRIPAYIRRTVQDPVSHDFAGQYWDPPEPYEFRHAAPAPAPAYRIYEAHVGMASEQGKVASFREFTRHVLPQVAELGYNALQLMAVMEHPYYGSFGYHVSSFFAVSSRFGTPEDLKELIDVAHSLGIRVLIDLVHSHAVKNVLEGLNRLDGTDHQYFHAPPRGVHAAWDSMVFDYAKPEVLRFLLSNTRYWLEDFRFDGIRFDGVTSMLYRDHGLARVFSGYDDYFGSNIDEDALTYLRLANLLAHQIRPDITTIAEDVSGMPGMARPLTEGGLGFDYRLAMGVPDYWIKLVKERRDEDWQLGALYDVMLNRRRDEKHVAYAESHDQALVGDQTLAFRLMGPAMYWEMEKGRESPVVDRGIALHKLIRLLTFALAGDAWLSFMGNEFGHPEWVDFPREGNHWSFHHARRQWSLGERRDLRYAGLRAFDHALQQLDAHYSVLSCALIERLSVHEDLKQLVCRRGRLVYAFNFHPDRSYDGLRIPVPEGCASYRRVLDSDAASFEGFGRIAQDADFPVQRVPLDGQAQSIQIYLPHRSALVLAPNTLG